MLDIYSSTYGILMILRQNAPFYIVNSTALENVYWLNVGGNDISPSHDTGLYRSWANDLPYLHRASFGVAYSAVNNTIQYRTGIPIFVAPVDVYDAARSMGPNPQINLNYNFTWIFSVDSGFSYLVRASTSSFFKLFYFTISKTTLSIIPYNFPIYPTYPKLYSFTILFKYYFLVFLYYLFPIVIFVRVIFCRIWLILWQNALYL